MTEPVEHTNFVIERDLPGSVRHAFRFWSDPSLKQRWSGCHADWTVLEDAFDFRAGGRERKRWRTPEGRELGFGAVYLDVVPEARIVYAYEMRLDGALLSASLVTVELSARDGGTRMRFTEQAAFVSGGDREQRIDGTNEGFDRLVEALADESGSV